MRGQNMTDDRTREMTQVARDTKPATVDENRVAGFFGRAQQAEDVLKTVEPAMAEKGWFGQARLKYAPNIAQSEENQVYKQAERQFIEAYLRRDSGAAIAQSEYENARQTFFVQPGDGPKIVDQKRKAREEVLKSLKQGAGRAMPKDATKDATAGAATHRYNPATGKVEAIK